MKDLSEVKQKLIKDLLKNKKFHQLEFEIKSLVLEKRSSLGSWSIILCISTFTLSVCGTFLVRSGILNSVHTFANDPERGLFILIFLFTLIFLSGSNKIVPGLIIPSSTKEPNGILGFDLLF